LASGAWACLAAGVARAGAVAAGVVGVVVEEEGDLVVLEVVEADLAAAAPVGPGRPPAQER
jgi:hypothetical protein